MSSVYMYSWYSALLVHGAIIDHGGGGNTGVGHVDLDLGVFPAELNKICAEFEYKYVRILCAALAPAIPRPRRIKALLCVVSIGYKVR